MRNLWSIMPAAWMNLKHNLNSMYTYKTNASSTSRCVVVKPIVIMWMTDTSCDLFIGLCHWGNCVHAPVSLLPIYLQFTHPG